MTIDKFIATPTRTQSILSTYEFALKKSLGQNFLIDVNILNNMIEHAGINEQSGVIEIGPGIGALTEQLAIHARQVLAVEIDQQLMTILSHTLKKYENIHLLHEDILEVNLEEKMKHYLAKTEDIHVIANLPYYITTPIIMKLLEDRLPIETLTIMIQKEVAERIVAKPNNKDYSSLSIAVQYFTDPEIVMDVPRSVFLPQPNVQSAVLKMKMREQPPVHVIDEDGFFAIVRACFRHRRKTLRNNLILFYQDQLDKKRIDHFLKEANIEGSRRAETLTIEEFASLANQMLTAVPENEQA